MFMGIKPNDKPEQNKKKLLQTDTIDEALLQITNKPKRQYSQEEIEIARGNALMNDRVFLATFSENKNNHIITDIVNALRTVHNLPPIPLIERTTVQNVSLLDVLGRGMIGDLLGEGSLINIAVEVQKGSQDGYAVRGTITSSNIMRTGFSIGEDFTEAPDVIGVNILGFRLPELENRKMFCSRIVRSENESKETFLADKYSDYYIELPKMDDWTKTEVPKEYHDLWDLFCIFKAKIKEHEEVIKMQAIQNPAAMELSREVRKTVAPNDFVNETLNHNNELEQLKDYFIRLEQKTEQKTAEKMIIIAFHNNADPTLIEAMRQNAGITESRLAELRKQAQTT